MAVAVIMPRQGNTVESCIITNWNKKPGDAVAVGDILFSYETDKAAFECEAETAGTLLKVLYQEGDDVPCLENVCVIGQPGEGGGHDLVDNHRSVADAAVYAVLFCARLGVFVAGADIADLLPSAVRQQRPRGIAA